MKIQNSKFKIQNLSPSKFIWLLLFLIIFFGGILRFWQLGKTPISPDWDEVSLGYNAYSILHTGRDEYGAFLPIVLKSFGDYKPALYAYLDIPAVAIFGLDTFAVRFPSAFFGVLTILLTFFFVKELCKKDHIALLASFLLAISPFSIQFSRVAFETNIGLFFNILGAVLFLKALQKPWLLMVAFSVFALNLYTYQSEKVFTPLLVLLLIGIWNKKFLNLPKKYIVSAVVFGSIILIPIVLYTFLDRGGLARAQGVSIFSSSVLHQSITTRYLFNKATQDMAGIFFDNSRLVYGKTIIAHYLSHFDLNWLFITGDINRHHAPDMGLLYLWELPFIVIGIYQLIFGSYSKKTKVCIFGWFLLAPLPAAITQDVPHAVRTMNFLPTYQIFTTLGIVCMLEILRKRKLLLVGTVVFLVCVGLFNFIYFLDQYFVQQNYFFASDWQYGYTQLVSDTNALSNKQTTVIVSNKVPLDESYIFFLFYLKYDPSTYQKEVQQDPSAPKHFRHYIFRPITWEKDSQKGNTLFVGNPSEFPSTLQGVKKIIYSRDGAPLIELREIK